MSNHSGTTTNAVPNPSWVASDHTLPDFIDEIEDGYYETNLHGSFTFVNDAICRITGYTRAEMVNTVTRRYSMHTDARTADRLKAVFAEVYDTGHALSSMEIPLLQKDGTMRHVDISVALITDAEGKPTGFRGFARDITVRRQIEAALRNRVQLLSLLQQVDTELASQAEPDAVLTVGMNAAMTLTRAHAGCIALIENGKMRIMRAVGVVGERDLDMDEGIIGRVLRYGQPEFVADVSADPDYIGDVPGMVANIVVPLHARDRLIGVINLETRDPDRFTTEIYEYVRLLATRLAAALDNALLLHTSQTQLAALQKLYAHVSDLERLKTDMIRIAAHDMRGPLAIIASYVELLREELAEHLDSAHQSYFEAIDRSIDRMTRLSTDVLSLERLQERQSAPTDLLAFDQVVREVADGFRLEAKERGLNYRIDVPVLDCMVLGDAVELGEAISNLISNALKYTPNGGKVTVTIKMTDRRASLEVLDTGYGVPESEQKRLFQAFSRIRTRDTVNIVGTGLGLHLVKKIVERHGGAIVFQSQPGVGSCFGFSLPLAPSEPRSQRSVRPMGA
ncbi:MAG: ATP-binding protein [Chloroflexota bacterium]|nr:ATP-binding protein [Chloroflexota bacterium]